MGGFRGRPSGPQPPFFHEISVILPSSLRKTKNKNKNKTKQKKQKIYTSKGEHGCENFGGITKVIKSYEGRSLRGGGGDQPYFTVLSPKSRPRR